MKKHLVFVLLILIGACAKKPVASTVAGDFDQDYCEQQRTDSLWKNMAFKEMYSCRSVATPRMDDEAYEVKKSNMCLFFGKETTANKKSLFSIAGYLGYTYDSFGQPQERGSHIVEFLYDHDPAFQDVENTDKALVYELESKSYDGTGYYTIKLDKKTNLLFFEKKYKKPFYDNPNPFRGKKTVFSTELACKKVI